MANEVLIIDYGMGNLQSVVNALTFCGCIPSISGDPRVILRADSLILPGVGSFRRAMETIEASGIADAIREAVSVKGKKILGICLGMQLFGARGSEDGDTPGLGFIGSTVDRFQSGIGETLKVPHVGFNEVFWDEPGELFRQMTGPCDFYFVHSYRMLPIKENGVHVAWSRHGQEFLSAFQKDNIFATQFHPEKSQTNGLKLLQNFLKA